MRPAGSSGLYQQKGDVIHQAFDRDFRAVPTERPDLPFEGTFHEDPAYVFVNSSGLQSG